MSRRRFSKGFGLFVLALLLTLAGCTTGRKGGGATATATTANNVLRIALANEPTYLDPAKVPDIPTRELLAQCFEGLVRYDEKNEIAPVLAERWEISPDGKTYTFHLRQGVAFHRGRPFVAEDVKYSWERALAPSTASSVAANYLEGIVGWKEVSEGKRKDLSGVEVADAHTLRVTLDRPRAYFLGMLAYPTGWVVCKEAVEARGGVLDEKAMVGTGPFTLEAYHPGQRMTLKANASYWGGKPLLERLEYTIIHNDETAYANFETNQVDILAAPLTRYAQDQPTGKFSSEYQKLALAGVDYLALVPSRQPALARKEARRALAMAIDREQIRKIAGKNLGRVANGFLPPGIPNGGAEPPPLPYDPVKAKALLAQAGYPEGKGFPTLTLSVRQQSPAAMETAQIVRANLRDNLGITVNLQEREFGQLISDAVHGKLEFYLANWIADYPDPQNFLSTLFVSINRVRYHNPAFAKLCAQADADPNPLKRATLYTEAHRILVDDVPAIPLSFGPRLMLIRANVKGWKHNLVGFLPHTQTTKQ